MADVERWKKIAGTDYSVSDLGRVAKREKGGELKIVKEELDSDGYSIVYLRVKGLLRRERVDTLVLTAFVGPPPMN